MPNVTLIGPGGVLRGRRSFQDRIQPEPFWRQLENLRQDDGTVYLRPGTVALQGNAPSAGTFRGGWIGVCPGYGGSFSQTNVALVAMEESGEIRIYKSHLNVTWQAWTEVTAASGKFGDTRLTAGTHVHFRQVEDAYGLTSVIASGGRASALRIDLSTPTATSNIVARCEAITAPPVSQYEPIAGFGAELTLIDPGGGAATTASDTGTSFTAAAGSATSAFWSFTLAATATAGDSAVIYNDTTLDISVANAKQLLMVCQYVGNEEPWWTRMRVEAVYGATPSYVTVYDPGTDRNEIVRVPVGIDQERSGRTELVAFPIEDLAGTIGSELRGIRLTVLSTFTPTGGTSSALRIFQLGVGGKVPGNSQYGVAFENGGSPYGGYTGSRCESPGVVLPPMRGKQHSVRTGDSVDVQSYNLPLDERIFYSVQVPIVAPNSTDGGRGVNYYNIFRKDPGSNYYYLASSTEVVAYSAPNWETVSGIFGSASAWGGKDTVADTVDHFSLDPSKVLPDAFNEPIPIGGQMAYANRRLYICTQGVPTSGNSTNAVMVSDEDAPYRFRRITTFDGDPLDSVQGFEARLDDRVTAVRAASASGIGTTTVYVWTVSSLWAVDGYQVRRIASRGTFSPWSVAESDGMLVWLDQSRNIVTMDPTIRSISRYRIDEDMDAIPAARIAYVSSAFHRDRMFFAHSATGQTDNLVSEVFALAWQEWEAQDTFASAKGPCQYLTWHTTGDETFLVYFASNGTLWKAEDPTVLTDDGNQIAFILETPYFTSPNFRAKVGLGQVSVICTDKASESLTTQRFPLTPAVAATVEDTGTINIDVSTALAWKVDKNATTGGPVKVNGAAVYLRVTGTLSGPFAIRAMSVAVDGFEGWGASA